MNVPSKSPPDLHRKMSPAMVAALVLLSLLAWRLSHILLLSFAGLLLAVLLRYLAAGIRARTGLPIGLALLLVIVAIALAIAGIVAWIGPQTARQFDLLITSIPDAVQRVEAALRNSPAGRFLLEQVAQSADQAAPEWNLLGTVGGALSRTANILFEIIVVITIAIFLAADPNLYRRGVLRLIPLDRRARIAQVMDHIGDGLWYWLGGQLVAMVLVGITAGIGLALLGVPLAAVLGFIAGVTNFIPQVGPYIAAVPAVLLAFTQDPATAIYTAILFLAIHQIEGNVILPLIQQRATDLPPALTIVAVVAGGVLFGPLGLLLATPLLYVIIILTGMLYVEDKLGDSLYGEQRTGRDRAAE